NRRPDSVAHLWRNQPAARGRLVSRDRILPVATLGSGLVSDRADGADARAAGLGDDSPGLCGRDELAGAAELASDRSRGNHPRAGSVDGGGGAPPVSAGEGCGRGGRAGSAELVSSNLILFGFYTEGTERGTQRPQSRKGAF